MDKKLLLVDDEPNILSALRRVLRTQSFSIITANSAQDALKILDNETIDVIMTDQRMPVMTGVEFLTKVKEKYPGIVRMVLSGYADIDAVTDAVNRGAIYKYLIKPWESEDLVSAVTEAFSHRARILEKQELEQKINEANEQLTNINLALEDQLSRKTQQLIKITQYDALTQLPNRLLFSDRLHQITLDRQDDSSSAVMIIGIDRFKLINETHGHAIGDHVLQIIGNILIELVDSDDTVARFGADEFGIILKNIHDIEEAAMAERILDRLQQPLLVDGIEIYLSASLGISVFPLDQTSSDELIRYADTAMHHAKEEGGNRYQYYSNDMNSRAENRLRLENDLRNAIKHDQFELHYQPQVNTSTQTVTGLEALIRWRHPQRGLLLPGEFIQILEETGLINEIGIWVIYQVIADIKQWQAKGVAPQTVSINLSAKQLADHSLIDIMHDLLADPEFDTSVTNLELEVTESALISNIHETAALLHDLSQCGLRIAIDDFGTGYASLSYLTRFPVDVLKIDQSFIARMLNEQNDAAIVRAIIAMAHSLSMSVVAEGVESEAQWEYLKGQNCDVVQGFYFSKPMSFDQISLYLSDYSRHPFSDQEADQALDSVS